MKLAPTLKSAPAPLVCHRLGSVGKKVSGLLFSAHCLAALCLMCPGSASADWKDEIGHTQLAAEVGAGLENGAGVVVSMAEALVPKDTGNYLIDLTNSQFDGKNIVDASGVTSDTSSHATNVASRFFGNSASIAPGVTNVTLYQADDWIGRVMGSSTGADPATQNFKVMNNSWIGNDGNKAAMIDILHRVDFMVDRDDVLIVAGANNGASSAVPDLLASGYNSLIVGRTDGKHSHGLTTINGAGRIRPHLVAPATRTSHSTPMVSSAAALLHQRATGTDATRNETMRSILMAGATKEEFPSWDRTTTRPLDDQFGAGELNVYNSYMILEGGQFAASATAPTFSVGLSGWDYVSEINDSETLFYNFTVDDKFVLDELSIALNWNLEVTDLNPSPNIFDPTTSLANLDMRFYDSTDSFQSSLLDASLSTVDNFEYLFLTGLTSGTYTLEVTSVAGATDFGIAWSGSLTAVPEPATWGFLAVSTGLLVYRRKQQSKHSTAT